MGCCLSREEKRQEHGQGGHGSCGNDDGHFQSRSAPPRSNLGEQQRQYHHQKPPPEFLRPKLVHGQDTILGKPFEDVRGFITMDEIESAMKVYGMGDEAAIKDIIAELTRTMMGGLTMKSFVP